MCKSLCVNVHESRCPWKSGALGPLELEFQGIVSGPRLLSFLTDLSLVPRRKKTSKPFVTKPFGKLTNGTFLSIRNSRGNQIPLSK